MAILLEEVLSGLLKVLLALLRIAVRAVVGEMMCVLERMGSREKERSDMMTFSR